MTFFPWIYGPRKKRTGHKSMKKNKDPKFTVQTEKNEANKMFII